ncbi:AAA family ATPase [Haliscomenobacter sp.]|uniref:AAA family ATPase n=1 Tax=Haliscomenobacter sp. TaxID=2717303 RepID=UPI0035940F1F
MSNGPSFGITSFHIEGFRGIKDTSVEGIPADTKWIFLTGKNGGGKTSVLQALFVGLFGNRDKKLILEDGEFDINIGLRHGKSSYFKATTGLLDGASAGVNDLPSDDDLIRKTLAYGASRLNVSVFGEEKSAQSYSLFNSDGILLDIDPELRVMTYRSSLPELMYKDEKLVNLLKKRVEAIKSLFLRLMPNIEKIEVDVAKDKVFFYEKDDLGEKLNTAKNFNQLASGNRNIIAMIGDMVIRLFNTQPEISTPEQLEGIVLIDELDVHLHPTWQKALPGLLSEIFPKIQFIASTHSPIPLLGAPKESVVLKVHQSSEAGITVEKLDIDLTRLLPNSLLTSPIFDLEEIIPTANTGPKDLLTEDSFEEAMANEEIKNRLKKLAQALK